MAPLIGCSLPPALHRPFWTRRWYIHPKMFTLCLTGELPTGAAYTNARLHKQRGWCRFDDTLPKSGGAEDVDIALLSLIHI